MTTSISIHRVKEIVIEPVQHSSGKTDRWQEIFIRAATGERFSIMLSLNKECTPLEPTTDDFSGGGNGKRGLASA